jgi:hypothetical protein
MRSIRAFVFSEELQTRLQSDEEKTKDTGVPSSIGHLQCINLKT